MILVSFSSTEDALTNDVKKNDTFSSQGTKNPPFRFFGDTRYSENVLMIKCVKGRFHIGMSRSTYKILQQFSV